MKKLLPVILAVVGLATGTGVGLVLKPKPPETSSGKAAPDKVAAAKDAAPKSGTKNVTKAKGAPDIKTLTAENPLPKNAQKKTVDYVKLNNQFVVPVVDKEKVAALVVMSLSVEVRTGNSDKVYRQEPKLRDAFLQVMFNHANSGGFDGDFTNGEKMKDLRESLFLAARKIVGKVISNVLITEIVRQDM